MKSRRYLFALAMRSVAAFACFVLAMISPLSEPAHVSAQSLVTR